MNSILKISYQQRKILMVFYGVPLKSLMPYAQSTEKMHRGQSITAIEIISSYSVYKYRQLL